MADNELFGISEQLNDTISRAAVVDEIEGVDWYHINRNGEMVHGANDAEHQAWYKADDIYAAIERVPSAQPVAKDINVPAKDCISRQAAIDKFEPWLKVDGYSEGELNMLKAVLYELRVMPSAQPEVRPIDYQDCSNAMLKMWMDNVVTDGEYNRIMDKLNAHWGKKDG